jgi:hypothetical protein
MPEFMRDKRDDLMLGSHQRLALECLGFTAMTRLELMTSVSVCQTDEPPARPEIFTTAHGGSIVANHHEPSSRRTDLAHW